MLFVLLILLVLLAVIPLAGCSMMGPQHSFGFIDKTGTFVIEPQYSMAYPFNEGLAPVMMGTMEYGKWGFIDTSGQLVIDYKYDRVRGFYEGLCPVRTGDDKSGKWSFIVESDNIPCGFVVFSQCDYGKSFVEKITPFPFS